jgi:GDP-L-fucose synthase
MTDGITSDSSIYVAGHQGLVGSAIARRLRHAGYRNLVLRTHQELELTDQAAVHRFLEKELPAYIFIAAAKVGGIQANNTYRADFIAENLAIELNVIAGAHRAGLQRLMFFGSSCVYPRESLQPIREEYLLAGRLEATNEPYAIAKIAGIKLCESFNRQYGTRYICAMPCNLFGAGDNYDPETAHVLPALIRKVHEAKTSGARCVTVWGSGRPRREFMVSEDLADACVFMMQHNDLLAARHSTPLYNVGCGEDFTIRELAQITCEVLGYGGGLEFDRGKPDGTPRKLLDVSRLAALGWRAKIPLREGIAAAYRDFLTTMR